ncbi:AsmA family protein [Tateyamaria sp. ANG-S1]|uniref:AsmA family protein n=1 Tax=Tateyamaria sp. ANG-S1 TaxID=1577905 RepID=UPI00057FF8EB|nr:AsmA family protein [Tateyamaria sp. ANG-S1]KIC51232.1 cell envelope biogenesis protein AsmA [Tateyamaria sp. ANG-S1]
MKWIIRLIGFVLVLSLVAIGSIFLLPADRIGAIAADQIRKATGRDVTITGVSMTLWPVLGVRADGLEVGNAEWSEQGPMLTAENAAIGVDLMAYIRDREIRITNVEATRPTIRLESRADGRASWVFTDASGEAQIEAETPAPTTTTSPPQALSIQKIEVTDATLIYDAEGADLVSYSGVDLTLDWPERLGPATIAATLRPAGTEVQVEATIGGFAGFITGQVQPVNATVEAGGGRVTLDGRASTAGDVAGGLGLDLPNTDAFMAALGLPAPGLPPKLGQSVSMTTQLTLTSDRRLSLRDLRADLGGNAINGAADISLNGTPVVNAQFNAGALDLSGATGGSAPAGGGASAPAPAGGGWPKDPIDASGLAAFNGEIALTASSIDLGQFKLDQTRTLLRNDRSRMVFELREVAAYGGTLVGEFVVNNRSGLSVGGNMNMRGLSLQPFLRDAADLGMLTGKADMDLRFLGVGQNVDAIMRSLSGNGAFNVAQGTIEGIDLDGLLKFGRGNGRTTVFDAMSASYRMEGGNLFNDDLLVVLRSFEARGNGRIGLGAQDIDYLFTPTALKGEDGPDLAIPVRIRGPWADPKILPDLDAAIDLRLDEKLEAEKEALKAKAEQRVREKVADELGVTDQGQDLEDAAKQKLEDEVKKGLRSLFD